MILVLAYELVEAQNLARACMPPPACMLPPALILMPAWILVLPMILMLVHELALPVYPFWRNLISSLDIGACATRVKAVNIIGDRLKGWIRA
jgi:hypothetical protein